MCGVQDCSCRSLSSPLPDLVVKLSDLVADLSVASFNFTARSCSLLEKCIAAPGQRRILRFTVSVLNQGGADVVLPDPTQHPLSFLFRPALRSHTRQTLSTQTGQHRTCTGRGSCACITFLPYAVCGCACALCSPCHQHYHYNHFAEYSLIRNNSVQLVGHKQVAGQQRQHAR